MNMYSLGVMDLDLSISPDVFGLQAFDSDRPASRMLPGSTPCELRLMLPDVKLAIDVFHHVNIENLSASPTWRSSHVSPADISSLRRCWPKAVFSTLRRRASDVERLCRDAPKRDDKAFSYSGPGFCGVCDTRVHTALDAHMIACHLELGQLWSCPVEWCAVWKGSGRAYLEHLAEKHGGSTLGATTNIFPPWTVTRDVWHASLRPDVSGSRGGCSAFPQSWTPSGTSLPGLQGPVSPSGALGRCYSPPAVLCVLCSVSCVGHGHRPPHSPENLDLIVGGSSGSGPCGVFSGGGGCPLCLHLFVAKCPSQMRSPCWARRTRRSVHKCFHH